MQNLTRINPVGSPALGQPFDDTTAILPPYTRITGMIVRHGNIVDAIQVQYGNQTLPQHGGNGGTADTVLFDPDDYLIGIAGYTGNWFGPVLLLQITLTTKNGKTYGPFGNMEYAVNINSFNFSVPDSQIIALSGATFATDNGNLLVVSSLGVTLMPSFDWRDLQLSWPLRFDENVLPIYKNGDPYLFPGRYTLLSNGKDYMGNEGAHNGIDIGFSSFRTTDNDGAKVYAAATGRLVAYRDGLPDRTNGKIDWKNFTPVNQRTVTNIVPELAAYHIQNIEDGSGNVIYLQHANGFITQYAHMKQGLPVLAQYNLGDTIPAGTVLGIMASSGSSSNSHLHFGVYTGPECNEFVSGGGVIPSSGRISTYGAEAGWGTYVCPFYQEPANQQNMWIGTYPTVYKPEQNGDIDIFDLAISTTPFDNAAPPPNASLIPMYSTIYIKPYLNGKLGNFKLTVTNPNGEVEYDSTRKNFMNTGEYLKTSECLYSSNGAFFAIMLPNGNFAVYQNDVNATMLWSTNTFASGGAFYAILQTDGSFCIYTGEQPGSSQPPLWSSPKPASSGPFFVRLGNDGNFCVYEGADVTQGKYQWGSMKYKAGLPRDCVILTNMQIGQYTVNAYRQLPNSTTFEQRAQMQYSTSAKLNAHPVALRVTPGSNNTFAAGDFYEAPTETQMIFTVYLDLPNPVPSIQFAEFLLPLTGITGINPFTANWGANMHLKASAYGKDLAYFSPVTAVGQTSEGTLFEPSQLFNPAYYGLSAWPSGGLPIQIAFEIATNNNQQSDYLTFGQPGLLLYY